jgi:hypothetical protein
MAGLERNRKRGIRTDKTLREAGTRYHYAGVWTVVLRFSRGYPYLAPLVTVTSNIDHAFLIDRSGGEGHGEKDNNRYFIPYGADLTPKRLVHFDSMEMPRPQGLRYRLRDVLGTTVCFLTNLEEVLTSVPDLAAR